MASTAAREHVEEIRRTKFSIGGEPNPLTEDLHQAVKNLSAELYAKDVHFLMELIQNSEDNEYLEGVDPSLEFVITSKDITATGAPATLLVFNNEKGFSPKNIESICSVGRSTKKGLRKRGYIGEKGIGFKSVFLITAQPYIFSNGYQIRFNEKPCSQCNVGYIVPEWVEENPTLSAIHSIYGSSSALPTTALVLPLKPEKVEPVKNQLSSVHPEVLLFLSKIKKLSVREDNEDPKLNTVSAISISSEINFVTRKNIDAESYTLHLAADNLADEVDRECGYYMWKQRFPVKQENKVDVRREVEDWVVTLAFPNGKRLNRGASLPGIYSFLPTETVTNFPFIIQADFLLASSRENILWDNKWNLGILDCVPVAFLDAFTSLVKSTEDAPLSSLPRMFQFLPVNDSSHPKLNHVRDVIKGKLMHETIVPCESYTQQKLFRYPCEVGRLNPAFWSILKNARSQGVAFHNISSHGIYVLSSSFDRGEYDVILNFLEIKPVDYEWYGKCISSSNLVMGVTEDVYLELLVFLAENWRSSFQITNVKNIPLIKYVGHDGGVSLLGVSQANGTKILLSADSGSISWLINWSIEFRCSSGQYFMPELTQKAVERCSNKQVLADWLRDEVTARSVTVNGYAKRLSESLNDDCKLVVAYAHFLYHSLEEKYLSRQDIEWLSDSMPLVDNYGKVRTQRSGVLVPARGSRWVELIGSNPWREYVELGEVYLHSASYAGILTPKEELIKFLQEYGKASDVPYLSPPDAAIPTLSAPLTKSNTFLLLKWLHNLRTTRKSVPPRFLSSIKDGCWLKVSLNGCPGYSRPSESFMLDSSSGQLLQNGSVLVDIPLVDHKYYGNEIYKYKDELQKIGVIFDTKEACEFIGKRLMSLAVSSNLTRDNVLSILNFVKLLRDKYLSPEDFINSIKGERWLKTSRGYTCPDKAVLLSQEWHAASQISDIPFVDQSYYGEEVLSFKEELKLLGVVVNFGENYQLVYDNLKFSSCLACLPSEATFFILRCIRNLGSSDKLVKALREQKCLMTNLGYRCPAECFLVNPESEWGCLLQVFGLFPVVDQNFYGHSIFSYVNQLKTIGVIVDFEEASKKFARVFKHQASLFSIRKENVISFMSCYRRLKTAKVKFSSDLKNCIRQEKWLRTRLGDYRSPNECILFGPDWESISPISLLPFIDDSENWYGMVIQDYHKELKQMGVVTDYKDGAKLVAAGLLFPQNSGTITPINVYALLECVKNLKEKSEDIPDGFSKKLAHSWLKTQFGYRSPKECLLFDPDWERFLERNDGPFIDEFYGPGIISYKEELRFLGVIVDVKEGCQLLASYVNLHSNFRNICRIFNYLCEFKWEPVDEDIRRIWIPRGTDNGEWVLPQDCVLHDKSNLFSEQLHVLDKLDYENKLLCFFANVFEVKVHPSVDDYCKLWKVWESSGHRISVAECCAFWEFLVRHWNPETQDAFRRNLLKLPVADPSCEGISLFDKKEIFIGDDLFLMDLFERSSLRPLFVWYPQPSLKSLPRAKMIDIYSKLGVRALSESAQKDENDVNSEGLEPVNPRQNFIRRGLFRLILGFLADLNLKIEAEKRHEAVSRLLEFRIFETLEPMNVQYSLSFSSGDALNVEARRMIRWDKQNSKFFMQKMDRSGGYRDKLEYASHFAEVIAEGVLWENEDLVPQLAELIRLSFLVDFEEAAVEFLMKTKNMQIFLEDQEFLTSTFSSN